MKGGVAKVTLLIGMLAHRSVFAQSTSSSPDKPWHSKAERDVARELVANRQPAYDVDPGKVYTLPELIDLAEMHNPDTRVAWENAKIKLAAVGIAASALYPSVAAVAIVSTWRNGPLIGTEFHRQTIGLFQPTLNLNYLIFDFGKRSTRGKRLRHTFLKSSPEWAVT